MANTLTNILDKILARALSTLREQAVMPRLVNTDYSTEAGQKGSTIDVPKPVAQTVSAVVPSSTPPVPNDYSPSLVQISLTNWNSTRFHLKDDEMMQIDKQRHFLPMNIQESTRALANDVDGQIHADYLGVYGFVGTAGTTQFSTVKTVTDARKVLNNQLAPMGGRNIVVDPDGEAQALQLAAFSDIEKSGDRAVKIEGELGRKLGFNFFMSQNVTTHTAGTAGGGTALLIGSTTAAGASSVGFVASAAAKTLLNGDIITIAGQSQTYVVTANSGSITSATQVAVTIDPPLQSIATANAVITTKATHVVNLGFTRGAFAFASRPLISEVAGELVGGNVIRSMPDPMTGIVLRLELSRQHKQNVWEFDILYGTKLLRPEMATRIAG